MTLENDLIPVNTLGVQDEETGKWVPVDSMALRSHTDRLTIQDIRSIFSDIRSDMSDIEFNFNQRLFELIGDISDLRVSGDSLVEKIIKTLAELTVNVKDYGALGDGKNNDAPAINKALELASEQNHLNVYFPPGVYRLNGAIRPRSNTTINGYGATIGRYSQHNSTLMMLYHAGEITKGYNGTSGVTVNGLTFEGNGHLYNGSITLLTAPHCSNITINSCTFKNIRNHHFIDLPGSKDIRISNCKFIGMEVTSNRFFSEAIQLDTAVNGSYGDITVPSENYDGTVTKNVIVEKCYFGASENMPAPRAGIGSHSATSGKFYENIAVYDCIFENLGYYGVKPMKWKASKVCNNYFVNCHGGVYLAPIPDGYLYDLSGANRILETGHDILVDGNTFVNSREKAIYVLGREDKYYSDVTLSNNTVSGTSSGRKGVFIRYAENILIDKHKSQNTGSQAIYAEFSKNIEINGGDIQYTKTDGLKFNSCVYVYANNVSIRNTGTHGLMTEGGCKEFALNNLRVFNPSRNKQGLSDGIYISNNTSDVLLSFNRVRSEGIRPRRGIWVTGTCSNVVGDGNDSRCRAVESDSFRNSATGAVERVANL